MTKVEELRDSIADVIAMADVEYTRRRDAERDLYSLISAAIEEGMAQEHQKISNDIADILFNARRPFLDVMLRNLKTLPEAYGDSLPVKEK